MYNLCSIWNILICKPDFYLLYLDQNTDSNEKNNFQTSNQNQPAFLPVTSPKKSLLVNIV